MKFIASPLKGVTVVEPEMMGDDRGAFGRVFCRERFAQQGIHFAVEQTNISLNRRQGTVRGMHFQRDPHGEPKLIRVTRGAILDVVVDIRIDSPTYRSHFSVRLDEWNRLSLYVPVGFAHGFQTLEGDTEVFYEMGAPYYASAATGVRWNDPALSIVWPLPISSISEKDCSYPDIAR